MNATWKFLGYGLLLTMAIFFSSLSRAGLLISVATGNGTTDGFTGVWQWKKTDGTWAFTPDKWLFGSKQTGVFVPYWEVIFQGFENAKDNAKGDLLDKSRHLVAPHFNEASPNKMSSYFYDSITGGGHALSYFPHTDLNSVLKHVDLFELQVANAGPGGEIIKDVAWITMIGSHALSAGDAKIRKPVPTPASSALLALGLACLASFHKRPALFCNRSPIAVALAS